MEINKKQCYFHLAVVLTIVLMDLFSDYVYGGSERFLGNFQLSLNYMRVIMYTATFTTYAVNFYFVCPYTLGKKHYVRFAIGVVFLIVIFGRVRYLLEEVLLFEFTGKHNYFEESRKFLFYTFDNSIYAIKGILYSTLVYFFFEYATNQHRIHKLELDYNKAELSLLKSQLEPHFLFNTLNAFYTDLVDDKPEIAKDILRLCQLLRYVTYEAGTDFMPLSKEINFIEDYIYLHRKRFEDTLFLEYDVTGIVSDQPVPSLVFIHFVENIFKHGVVTNSAFPAKISIIVTDEFISMETANLVSVAEQYSASGIGKENLKRRLSAIFKQDYILQYDQSNDIFTTILKLPFKIKS
ncbi:sensor histidine kinase [Flavobacterium sp. WC2409]|uniref:Sensor histidine kinase n=1 Tax=Flavobacterium sp. WC2409 TaxID=3234139 RepID=A0AB39W4G2_9FLAO